MVYTCDSKSHAARLEGSSPSSSTLLMIYNKPKIIAIVGPTASGKSALGIELALHYSGEVVSCDSRQVYKGLDIGSGKVTVEEMRGVPHHLLDIADPQNTYTAADYVGDATRAIRRILERDHLPIIVGGSFMYLDSLLGHISLPPVPPDLTLRAALENLSLAELSEKLKQLDPKAHGWIDHTNRRRLIRAIEIASFMGHIPETQTRSDYDELRLGIKINRPELRHNIKQRLTTRLEHGMIEEVEGLLKSGISHDRLEALGLEYRYLSKYLRHEIDKTEMINKIENKSYQYAKRQETWLKRNPNIKWLDYPVTLNEARNLVDDFMLLKSG
jgi:tRNA dimethylallyltransferase